MPPRMTADDYDSGDPVVYGNNPQFWDDVIFLRRLIRDRGMRK